MVLFQPALTLTGVLLKGIFARIVSMRYGKRNSDLSEIETGQKPDNVNIVLRIPNVRETGCIIGMGIKKMYWFATMKRLRMRKLRALKAIHWPRIDIFILLIDVIYISKWINFTINID